MRARLARELYISADDAKPAFLESKCIQETSRLSILNVTFCTLLDIYFDSVLYEVVYEKC